MNATCVDVKLESGELTIIRPSRRLGFDGKVLGEQAWSSYSRLLTTDVVLHLTFTS